jgi:large subunit ribosomal protein L25
MSANTSISVIKRDQVGKRACKRLRASGRVPGVLYGNGFEATSLSFELKDLLPLIRNPSIISLKVDGNDETALLKNVQFDYSNRHVVHVDFQQIKMDQTIRVEIPLETHGVPAGTEQGGQLNLIVHQIEVECLPDKLPDRVVIEVAHLQLGDSIAIGDIPLPDGVDLICSDPGANAVQVAIPHMEEEAEAETLTEAVAATEEPEVIAKGKKEEEESSE